MVVNTVIHTPPSPSVPKPVPLVPGAYYKYGIGGDICIYNACNRRMVRLRDGDSYSNMCANSSKATRVYGELIITLSGP